MDLGNDIVNIRYLSIAGLSLMVFDHLITVDQEVIHIWLPQKQRKNGTVINLDIVNDGPQPQNELSRKDYHNMGRRILIQSRKYFNLHKLAYVMNRYLVEAIAAYLLFVFFSANDSCKQFACILIAPATVFTAVTQLFLISWGLATGFVIQTLNLMQDSKQLIRDMTFLFLSAFAGQRQLMFDVCLILVTIYNALEIPYRRRTDVIIKLRRDGIRFFVILVCLKVLGLLLALYGSHWMGIGLNHCSENTFTSGRGEINLRLPARGYLIMKDPGVARFDLWYLEPYSDRNGGRLIYAGDDILLNVAQYLYHTD
ncbi:hypothetical protein K435DRAFT_800974 [Dendrothele bispora CBS 962.96]|uniref:DUF6533 domain-containing protein n=1 Tax=Dendrothele bispora (strain CBS 962.96) TaxID=1314807 RepID=A0A4S8LQY4_DENBC|nr:hypothetical protein K435DRAFT_800974 [Dendrothele bispora CBS 962.96]